nr:GNAT family N-acetyltransferase [uncultured Oscillibacter sp.]
MDHIVRPYRPGEEAYIADAQGRVCSEEHRWGPASIDYAMKVALDHAARPKDDREEMWAAEADGKPIGCIMLCRPEGSPDAGQLRLFLAEEDSRRCGIGRSLTSALLQKAREAGYRRPILWTASPLTGTVRPHEALGAREAEEGEDREWNLEDRPLYEIKMVMTLS